VKVLLYGVGRSGLAAGRLLARQGHEPVWFDRRETGDDLRAAHAAGWPRTRRPHEAGAELCIAAPGVPIDHPDLVALRGAGIETIGEIEWVGRTVDAPMIGVTGTAGKGTVTRWTEALLRAGGVDAVAGGNLDPALAAVARPGAWLVVELSSFQLERSPRLHPRIAVVTTLGRDHLDRHGTLERYHAVKRRLLENLGDGDVLIVNADDPHQAGWGADLPVRRRDVSVEGRPAYARIEKGRLRLGDADLGPEMALGPPGRHQRANLLTAAVAAEAAGVDAATIARQVPALTSAPGRHERIAEACGVRFVEDSIATRELAVRASLDAARPPVAWIVGGRDKGADPAVLAPLVREKVREVIGVGEAGPRFVEALADAAPGHVVTVRDGPAAMAEAVRRGAETLRAEGGGTLLLAPLAASFDQFDDHRARGRAFRAAVAALLEEEPWTGCS